MGSFESEAEINLIKHAGFFKVKKIGVPMEGRRSVRVVIEFNNESLLTDVCWDALQLKSLENGPIEKILVSGGEFPEALDQILIVVTTGWLLLRGRKLRGGVLANRFVGRPVAFLTVR